MKEELVKRGVTAENIAIVPNGVTKLPEIKPANPALKKRLGIEEGDKVVGYIGSFNEYEGIDELVVSCKQLHEKGFRIKLLLVGDDQAITNVVTNAQVLSLEPWLIQVGRISHELIQEYYSLVDLVVMPRKNLPVCRIVQPTKFIEASSCNIPVLVPSYCEEAIDDIAANAVAFKEGDLSVKIAAMLPQLYCGKYNDDKRYAYEFKYKIKPMLNSFGCSSVESKNKPSDIEIAFDMLTNNKGSQLLLEEEKWLRELSCVELKNGNITNSLALAKFAFLQGSCRFSFKFYVKALFAAQKYDRVVDLCDGHEKLGNEVELIRKKSASYLEVYKEYYETCESVVKNESIKSTKSVYFLHSSLPYFSGGYATRAHGLASALVNRGLDVKPYTRPNFPYDVKKDIKEESISVDVDGLVYTKTACKSARLKDEASYMLDCIDVFEKVIEQEQPGYIHGRSTYQIALPALIAAKKNNLPFVYEVSGLWEIVHESRETAPQRKYETEKIRHLETMTAIKADIVFTLTGAMKNELISRGVNENKIHILPNCTNPEKFVPCGKSPTLLKELDITPDIPVIGYIGSFQDYEGLDDLIDACELIHKKQPNIDFRLLLVGDGPYFNQIPESVRPAPGSTSNPLTCMAI
ncbi:hypothetical protein GCM10007157_35460 [Vreelandella hamiltonii]|uniref:Glycosyltransferase n=2 Tax=Vreelandella hamiltonii TaxID=502829 RepID=A0A8H9I696_9GAMM|nr:hypothetical protein GCM10007157_35460 [Halomonas hamiltonii]